MVFGDHQEIAEIARRLLRRPQSPETAGSLLPDWPPDPPFEAPPVPAAVLIPLIVREQGISVLYTERSAGLRSHSGQVAFPGGKIDATDAGPADAALREAWEETGLLAGDARVLGYMPLYFTGSNYLITPVVAVVRPSRPFVANPSEVSGIFEVPLEKLRRRESYAERAIDRAGKSHTIWTVEHEGHEIWGITANLTRKFRELALEVER